MFVLLLFTERGTYYYFVVLLVVILWSGFLVLEAVSDERISGVLWRCGMFILCGAKTLLLFELIVF